MRSSRTAQRVSYLQWSKAATRGLLKERNLRRDARMSLCVEDGLRYVSLQGHAELLEDRGLHVTHVRALRV